MSSKTFEELFRVSLALKLLTDIKRNSLSSLCGGMTNGLILLSFLAVLQRALSSIKVDEDAASGEDVASGEELDECVSKRGAGGFIGKVESVFSFGGESRTRF